MRYLRGARRRLSSQPLRTKLLGSFGLVIVVLVILTSAAYRTTTANQEAADAVDQSQRIIRIAQETFTELVNMETGYRGYLLTGRDDFLEPYVSGQQRIDANLAELERLTADNPDQLKRWEELRGRIQDWKAAVTEPGIKLRQEIAAGRGDLDDLGAWVAIGSGKERFDVLRQLLTDAITTEDVYLSQREAVSAQARRQLLSVLLVGTLGALALAVVLALLLTVDIATPVGQLAASAKRLAEGDLDQRVGLRRRDEIGVAAQAFDEMAGRLQTVIVRNQTILATAAEGIVGLDRDARVTFANPAATEALGQPLDDLLGRAIGHRLELSSDLASVEANGDRANGSAALAGPPAAPDLIGRTLATGTVEYGAQAVLRRGDGRVIPIEYASAPIWERDAVVGAVVTFRDVTERRAAERALTERARELARSNAELEQFAYVASHDLQEPLRAVVSYLQLLERRYKGNLDERADKYIGYAVDGARRMQTLINDLLTYSRAGRRHEQYVEVDLEALLTRVMKSLEVGIEESGASVTHDPLPTIVADPVGLGQLLQNLVGNAIKFRSEQPPTIHVSARRQERAWLVSVRDNGIGIAPEYQERIFVLFQRLHGRDEYAGTGIGLAICKKIVERHGGMLWVESTPGGGSTFLFTIPDAQADA
jgi:signal transduction histidine kinase/CHASE3 domain sensor protein